MLSTLERTPGLGQHGKGLLIPDLAPLSLVRLMCGVGVARTEIEMIGSPIVGFGWAVTSHKRSETTMQQTDLRQLKWGPWQKFLSGRGESEACDPPPRPRGNY